MKDYSELTGRIAVQLSPELTKKFYDMLCDIQSTYETEISNLKQERDNYKRVLKIINEKCVDVGYVITLFMYKDYNSKMDELWGDAASSYYLTKEEFDLLKEWSQNGKGNS